MSDKDRVIKGLTHCIAWNGLHECQPKVGDDCPYVDEADCKLSIMYDALVLLKDQEAVKPIKKDTVEITARYEFDCQCGAPLLIGQPYCANCGRSVKWE